MEAKRILIVAGDQEVAEKLRASLRDWGYRVDPVLHDGEAALHEVGKKQPNLVLIDFRLSGTADATAAAGKITGGFRVPLIFIGARQDEALLEQAHREGLCHGYLLTPLNDENLVKKTVETVLSVDKSKKPSPGSQEAYRHILDEMTEGYYETDLEGNFTFINHAMTQIIGLPRKQLQGANNRDFMEPRIAKHVFEKFNDVFKTGVAVKRFGYELRTKDGMIKDVEISIELIKDAGDEPVGFRGVARDVSEKRKLEVQLIKTRNFLQNVLSLSHDGISTTDMKGRIVYANFLLWEMLGYEQKDLIGKRVELFYRNGKKDAKHIMAALTQGDGLKRYEMQMVGKDGNYIDAILSASLLKDESGAAIGTVGIFKDITEKKRMEDQFLHSQKLESVGVLAGGIAHDFNNLLTAVVGNISLAKMYAKAEGKLVQILTEAERACGRAKEVTERLLNFSRGEKPVKRVDAVGRLMQDVIALVLSGSNICYEFDVPSDLWLAEYNPEQIKQAIANIALNAVEAMPKGGIIRAGARNVEFNRKRTDLTETIPEGKYVELSISDHGVGISPIDLPKIFDPYFSTKEQGAQKGMGLGLTTVYSIIKAHDGFVNVESTAGTGTTIQVFLPAYDAVEEGRSELIELGETSDRGKGKILVMDDEEIVREVVGEMLKEVGYSVKYAKDGSEAIELYQKAKGAGAPFQAVILDVTVRAGMGGKETIKRLLEIDPHVHAFVSSGYSDEPIMVEHRKYGFIGAIPKPFSLQILKAKLDQTL